MDGFVCFSKLNPSRLREGEKSSGAPDFQVFYYRNEKLNFSARHFDEKLQSVNIFILD